MSRRDQTNADLLRDVAKTFANVAYFQRVSFNFLFSKKARSTVYRFARHSFPFLVQRTIRGFEIYTDGTGRGKTWRELCQYGPARCQTLSFSHHRQGFLPFPVNGKLDHSGYEFWRQPAGTLTTAEAILARLFQTTIRDIGAREINQRCKYRLP